MGLDFGKSSMGNPAQAGNGLQEKNEIEVVEKYDIVADRQQMNAELVNSKEVDDIVSTIEVYNMDTIVSFGAKAAEEISKASDVVLNSMNMSQLNETSEMLKSLAKIMDQFDINEIKDNPGLFEKLFGNFRKQLDKILAKYHTMGEEVDKIYVQLKGYESEIKQSNKKLDTMFKTNVDYYHELVKYILAGEQACKEIEAYIAQRQQDMENTGDQSIQFELTSLNQANSAFIVTLPVFKQALAQAILLKRQKIQAESIAELDKKTNEMLLKNAQNTVDVSKMTAKMASGSSIQIETLEKTWATITNGIEETRRIQEDARKKRQEDQVRLEAIKQDFNKQYNVPPVRK